MTFRSGMLSAAILCSTTLLAQQPKILAPHKPFAPKLQKQIKGLERPMRRAMIGGLWRVGTSLKSAIYVRNIVETDAIKLTPILYLSNGNKYMLADVTVEAGGTAIIDINQGLEKNGISSWAALSGYAELQYDWAWDPFCATIRSVDVAHSLIYSSSLRPTSPPSAQIVDYHPPTPTNMVEGMWWKQNRNVTAFVSVANLSAQPAKTTVLVSDGDEAPIGEHTLVVSPHGMKVIYLPELQTTNSGTGGIRITSSETTANLVVNGGLEDLQSGYSANIPFTGDLVPATKPEQAVIAELGLMSGAADPMMLFPARTAFTPYSVVRNVSNSQLSLTPTLWWMEGAAAHSARLPQFGLRPHQTKSLDMTQLLAAYGPKNFNGTFNLIFDGDIQSGVLLMASGSVDQTDTYVFEAIPRGIAEGASKSLQYWSTGNGDDTMVSVWNPADEPQDFTFTLFFTGGHYLFPIHLDARATRNFNISEIIQNQVPDVEGNVIPPSISEGGAKIGGSRAENQPILVGVEMGVYNVRKATCTNSCQTCNGYSDATIIDGLFDMNVSATKQQNFIGTWGTGAQYNWNSGSSWSTNASSVATVQTGLVTSVSPGGVSITSLSGFMPIQVGYICTGNQGYCPTHQYGGSSGGTVAPVISLNTPLWYFGSGITPPSGFTLGSTSATLTASGATQGTFAWTITAGSSKLQFENGSSTITKTNVNSVGVSSKSFSTASNDVTISLTYTPSGGPAATRTLSLTVDSPYKLVDNGGTIDQGVDITCSASGSDGWRSVVKYKVLSFLGVQISHIGINETFTTKVDDYTGNTWPAIDPFGVTTPDGTFFDDICAVSSSVTPVTLPPQSPLSSVKIDHASQAWFVGSETVGSGVQVQSNTIQRYQDHGRHLQPITSPVR